MKITRKILMILAIFCLVLSTSIFAQWTEIRPGIHYREYTISGPNNVFVARLTRSNTSCTIDSCIGQGNLTDHSREVVSHMANRYDDIISYWGQYWGQRYDVVVAINGDFWTDDYTQAASGIIHSGSYAKRFTDFTGGSGFAWQLDRDAFIGGCVRHIASKNKIQYPETAATQNINGVNTDRGSDDLILYTPEYDSDTNTDNSGVEVLVEMERPSLIMPPPNYARGYVREIRQNLGSTHIPFDHVVISAKGSAASKVLSNVSIGSEIGISQEITHYEKDCSTSSPWDWTKTYASIGGGFVFLKDSVVQSTTNTDRHPRTAVALNADYIFFFVVDGRSTQSIGMTYADLADFSKNTLGATDGINQDGGGSSAIWVDGEIKNVPSDGSERATHDGLMMISILPKTQSSAYVTDDEVITKSAANLRLGPGTNFSVFDSVAGGERGTILDHSCNGVLAKGKNWWKCDFDGDTGWVEEGDIEIAPTSVRGAWCLYE